LLLWKSVPGIGCQGLYKYLCHGIFTEFLDGIAFFTYIALLCDVHCTFFLPDGSQCYEISCTGIASPEAVFNDVNLTLGVKFDS
jgi:hypothetical protein